MTDDLAIDDAMALVQAIERGGGACIASDGVVKVVGIPRDDALRLCAGITLSAPVSDIAFFAVVAAAQTIRRARG